MATQSKANVLLRAAHRVFETPLGYNAIQLVNRPTVAIIRSTIGEHLRFGPDRKLLDVGCGTGNYRGFFTGTYVGVDVNADYIELCKQRLPGTFLVMDGTRLDFPDASFDEVFTVATTHHLDDAQLGRMVQEGLRVVRPGGFFHIVDAVLPASARSLLKTVWFRMDRGRHPRKLAHLTTIIERHGEISKRDLTYGLLHDIAYFRVGARASA